VQDRGHHAVGLGVCVDVIPRRLVEKSAAASRAVEDAHIASLLGHHQRAAVRAAPAVQFLERILLRLLEVTLLLRVQLADALRVLPREVLLLLVAGLVITRGHFCSAALGGGIDSMAIFARSCCGESLSVSFSSLRALASSFIIRYAR